MLVATSPKKYNIKPSQVFASGFIAGIISRTCSSPLDITKVLLQTNSGDGIYRVVADVYHSGGLRAFWRGNSIAVFNQGPQTAIKYFVFEEVSQYVQKLTKRKATPLQRAVIGSLATITAQTIMYPCDFLRTRITTCPTLYKTPFQTISKIVREEGLTTLWTGLGSSFIGAIIYGGTNFCISGTMKEYFSKRAAKKHAPLKPYQYLMIGACAGGIAQSVAYPFDAVKKRLMAKDIHGNRLYTSTKQCVSKIYQEEGIPGFFKGVHLNFFKVIPYTAIQYFLNEEVKNAFIKYNNLMDKMREGKKKNKKNKTKKNKK